MADGNEDLRADDLPGPAYEGYESMELACPAERSGHVAVSDGRHMFVWGGYKVSGWPHRCGRLSAVTWAPVGGPGGQARAAASGIPRRDSPRGFIFLYFFCMWHSSHESPNPPPGSWTVVMPTLPSSSPLSCIPPPVPLPVAARGAV